MDKKNEKSELDQYASLVAHQMKSPVASANLMLKTLLDGFAGPLTAKQQDLLSRIDLRMTEAMSSIKRMLAIARPESLKAEAGESVELSQLLLQCADRFSEEASGRGISLESDPGPGTAFAGTSEAVIAECLNSLVSNALKYTPDHGRIILGMTKSKTGTAVISVADSGIGVPESSREKIFEPFFRTAEASESSRPGLGLGLAFVKSLATALGGSVRVEQSELLGGAKFILEIPLLESDQTESTELSDRPQNIVIIGGVTAGPKAAAKIIRMCPETKVTIVEQGELLSYSGCGLPHYIAGTVKDQKELLSTAEGKQRDPVFFQNVKNINIINRTKAEEIDRKQKKIKIRHLYNSGEAWLDYDKLVIATGSKPSIPEFSGMELKNIFTLYGPEDAEGIRNFVAGKAALEVVIIGGGLVGLEMTEALVARGCRVTIVEKESRILRILDPEMAVLVEKFLASKGIKIITETEVTGFSGNGKLSQIITDKGKIPADMCLIATGVVPCADLAKQAGLKTGETGGIKVNDKMQTSDPDIFAAGDCVENLEIISGKKIYLARGSVASRQGRVAAVNLCGGNEIFKGILQTSSCRIFDFNLASTGLTESSAKVAGLKPLNAYLSVPDRETFLPGVKQIMLKLTADRDTRKILGLQAVGPGDCAGKIDTAAMAISMGAEISDLNNLDFSYSPMSSLSISPLAIAANVLENKLSGLVEGIPPFEVYEKIRNHEEFIFLDVRDHQERENERLAGTVHIPLGALRARSGELDADSEIIIFSKTSLKAYEASLILRKRGFNKIRIMDGGIDFWPYDKVIGLK
jgi:NADPH-dependent 2,4-dienoyl-CoA reductase/sulfur reductase-like enzyme/rhodanese-related sulfurtransferase/two-component sensor histidine kinase